MWRIDNTRVAWPGSPAHRELTFAELDRLRAVEAAARQLVAKVDEHERKGYNRIKLGAADALRRALAGTGVQ